MRYVTISRVQVIWAGGTVAGGGLSTFYFNSAVGTAAQQVAAVAAFLGTTEDRRTTGTTWATAGDVAQINEATGDLVAINSVTPATGVGTDAGDALAIGTSGLLRLFSSVIANGRLVRGRIFLPGASEGQNTAGVPISAYRSDYDAAAATLLADVNTEWRLWSRTHGIAPDVTTATTWTKWSFLRSRRD
jgi:hypothetical protein